MAERPLTERQEKIVLYLLGLQEARSRDFPPTPNEIACAIGLDGDRARRLRGPWSGQMGPAQRVIGSLNGLSGRKLIGHMRRRDGYSGSAYGLTDAGLERARELRAERTKEQ